MQHRTETTVEPNGTIILRGLPFQKGDQVVVVVSMRSSKTSYPLRGQPVEYKQPFESVGELDWISPSGLQQSQVS